MSEPTDGAAAALTAAACAKGGRAVIAVALGWAVFGVLLGVNKGRAD